MLSVAYWPPICLELEGREDGVSMTPEYERYFAALHPRLKDAKPVPFVTVAIDAWNHGVNRCHENVARYAAGRPGRSAVPGWLIEATDGNGGYLVAAHSVVEEDGKLFDITPAAATSVNTRGSARRFIRHDGTAEEFDDMLPEFNQHWVLAP
jgi:hypothetical protein